MSSVTEMTTDEFFKSLVEPTIAEQLMDVAASGRHYIYTKYGVFPMTFMVEEHGGYCSGLAQLVGGPITMTFKVEDVAKIEQRDTGYYEVHLK